MPWQASVHELAPPRQPEQSPSCGVSGPTSGCDPRSHRGHAPLNGFMAQLIHVGCCGSFQRGQKLCVLGGNIPHPIHDNQSQFGRRRKGELRIQCVKLGHAQCQCKSSKVASEVFIRKRFAKKQRPLRLQGVDFGSCRLQGQWDIHSMPTRLPSFYHFYGRQHSVHGYHRSLFTVGKSE